LNRQRPFSSIHLDLPVQYLQQITVPAVGWNRETRAWWH